MQGAALSVSTSPLLMPSAASSPPVSPTALAFNPLAYIQTPSNGTPASSAPPSPFVPISQPTSRDTSPIPVATVGWPSPMLTSSMSVPPFLESTRRRNSSLSSSTVSTPYLSPGSGTRSRSLSFDSVPHSTAMPPAVGSGFV